MDIDDVRWEHICRLDKETLIDIYLRGVRQPNGNVIYSAGPASALRKWRRIELIQTLLQLGWPGASR